MIHQFRDKKQIERRKATIRTILWFGLFIILSSVGLLALSGKIFNPIGTPIWKADNAIADKITSTNYLIRTKVSVFDENEKLQEENDSLRASMLDYQILERENLELKELLGRLPTVHDFTLATILTKPNRSPYDTIIIDVGSDLGISEGMQVLAFGNIPIGEISKVYASNSLVMLYSNPGQSTEGVIDGSNASIELIGRGGGNFEMTLPLDLPADKGMRVLLPNADLQIIAIVDAIISNPTDPVKKVILHSPANIQSLKWVQVKKD